MAETTKDDTHDVIADGIKWLAQTVHQAHHSGSLEECPKSTCAYAMTLIDARKVELTEPGRGRINGSAAWRLVSSICLRMRSALNRLDVETAQHLASEDHVVRLLKQIGTHKGEIERLERDLLEVRLAGVNEAAVVAELLEQAEGGDDELDAETLRRAWASLNPERFR